MRRPEVKKGGLAVVCKECKDKKPFRNKYGQVQFNDKYVCDACTNVGGNTYARDRVSK